MPVPSPTDDVHQRQENHCQEFIELHVITKNVQSIREPSRFDDFLVEIDTCDFDIYAFVKRGVVMILNRGRGRRHRDINCSSPEVQPIAVLELALGESLLWKCLMSICGSLLRDFMYSFAEPTLVCSHVKQFCHPVSSAGP